MKVIISHEELDVKHTNKNLNRSQTHKDKMSGTRMEVLTYHEKLNIKYADKISNKLKKTEYQT